MKAEWEGMRTVKATLVVGLTNGTVEGGRGSGGNCATLCWGARQCDCVCGTVWAQRRQRQSSRRLVLCAVVRMSS